MLHGSWENVNFGFALMGWLLWSGLIVGIRLAWVQARREQYVAPDEDEEDER